MDCRIRRSRPMLLAAAATTLVSTTLLGNVTVNQWTDSNHFHHKRVGVPDQDQKRVGLPNSGSCYCVPTSVMNMLIYIANHGYPQVTPGPGDYSGYEHYYEITDLLETLGADASISPGGDDPDDPDCQGDSEGDGTPDGECNDLPCGGKVSNVYNSILDLGWLGSAQGKLTFTARFLNPNAPTVTFPNLAQLGLQGNILVFCYGRYKPVGATPQGQTIYKRSGGHCVTMNEAFSDGGIKRLYSRDPGQDDGDIFGPSPYTTKSYVISSETIQVTESEEGGILTWAPTTLPGLDEPHGDGKKRLVDSYFAIKPKTGVFWKDYVAIKNLPLAIGLGGNPDASAFDLTAFALNDLVLDQDLIGWYVLTAGSEVSVPKLMHINPVAGTSTPIVESIDAHRVVRGRLDDLYAISATTARLYRYDGKGNLLKTVQLQSPPSAIAYDDANDLVYVLRPGSSGFGGTLMVFPRSLGSEVEPVHALMMAPNLQLGGATALAVNPADASLWVSSETSGNVCHCVPDYQSNAVFCTTAVGGFAHLTGLEFDDAGTMHVVHGGAVSVYERDRAGGWQPGDASAFAGVDVGSTIRVSRSRSNFDESIHDPLAWDSIDTEELLPIGTVIPDCIGDLDGDSVVDGTDLAILLGAWGGTGIADLDQSGTVDGADLAIVLGAWGPCPRLG